MEFPNRDSKQEEYNGYLLQAKVSPEVFQAFWTFCRLNNLNRSSGVKQILSEYLLNQSPHIDYIND